MISGGIEHICKDYKLIENYEDALSDTNTTWDCHHRLELSEDGQHTLYTSKELKSLGLYYDRPPEELIFLTSAEHHSLHANTIERKHFSEDHKKKISEAHKGICHSDEAKQKISDAGKGRYHSDETKQKISELNRGRHHSEEAKRKMSEARKGKVPWNKGVKLSEEHKQKLKLGWQKHKQLKMNNTNYE